MPRKPNFNYEKHQKEVARRKRKAEKRQRKADRKAGLLPPEETDQDATEEKSE